MVAEDMPLPPPGTNVYRVNFKEADGTSFFRQITAKNPDDALGELVDALRAEHNLDVEDFHQHFLAISVTRECSGDPVQ